MRRPWSHSRSWDRRFASSDPAAERLIGKNEELKAICDYLSSHFSHLPIVPKQIVSSCVICMLHMNWHRSPFPIACKQMLKALWKPWSTVRKHALLDQSFCPLISISISTWHWNPSTCRWKTHLHTLLTATNPYPPHSTTRIRIRSVSKITTRKSKPKNASLNHHIHKKG